MQSTRNPGFLKVLSISPSEEDQRFNLFTYRELTQWLHNPTETPPLLPAAEQLALIMG